MLLYVLCFLRVLLLFLVLLLLSAFRLAYKSEKTSAGKPPRDKCCLHGARAADCVQQIRKHYQKSAFLARARYGKGMLRLVLGFGARISAACGWCTSQRSVLDDAHICTVTLIKKSFFFFFVRNRINMSIGIQEINPKILLQNMLFLSRKPPLWD